MGIFTGLILETGSVRRIVRRTDGAYLEIDARVVLEGTRIGDSISINGVDLTVVRMDSDSFGADATLETLGRSTLGELRPGVLVNLERALAVGERLGGHMVQGHVDGIGTVVGITPEGNSRRLKIRLPKPLQRYVALKGSVAVDGMSLTVAGLGDDWFEVAVIPHSWRQTIVRNYKPADAVNIEVDVLAKYVERLLSESREGRGAGTSDKTTQASSGKLSLDYLIE
ncbi:MAG TPA: riboflavin synthase, partial [Blastocatellia bacterium]|nr:riboflavin synthase [Blastocatellia bacterium]